MKSSKLRNKVLIEKQTASSDELGGEVSTWSTFQECYVSVEPLRGQELFVSQQTYNKVISRIRMRYVDDIKTDMRVNYNGRIFEIEAVLNINERNKELHLMCSEVV